VIDGFFRLMVKTWCIHSMFYLENVLLDEIYYIGTDCGDFQNLRRQIIHDEFLDIMCGT